MLETLDMTIVQSLTSFSDRSQVFNHAVNALARYNLFKGVVMVTLFWFTWFTRHPCEDPKELEARRSRLSIVLLGSLVIVAVSRVMQVSFPFHKRPLVSGLGFQFPELNASIELHEWSSFPSSLSDLTP